MNFQADAMDKQADALDRVIKNTMKVMEESKYQVFEIAESARTEKELLEKELQEVMTNICETIEQVDRTELDFRRSRIRLSEVSRNFNQYTEADIKKAYEIATEYQMQLTLLREKEQNLRSRRDELNLRIRNIEKTIERAETVVTQMDMINQILSGDLHEVGRIVESAKNRQMLGLKIILAQEEERRRIAREIHDGLAQSMAHLVLRTEISERMLEQGHVQDAVNEIRSLRGQMRSGLEEVRKIIFNLRPMTLDDLGLVPTLRKFTQDFEEKYKIHTCFTLKGEETRLSSAMEIAIFRFVQEAFSNVQKHSRATHVSLEMTFDVKEVKIKVEDNGIGFVTAEINEKIRQGSHFGLLGMRERIEMLEGRFSLDSRPNEGTRIEMCVPLEDKQKRKLKVKNQEKNQEYEWKEGKSG